MNNIFVRILIAVVFCLLIFALIPPVLRIIGFPLTSDLELIIRVVVAACALWYIIGGSTWFAPRP